MTIKYFLFASVASLTVIGCGAIGMGANSAPTKAAAVQTGAIPRVEENGSWAMVCSEGQIGRQSPVVTDNSIITRQNCKEVFGRNEYLEELFGLLRGALMAGANCREMGFGLGHLRLVVISSEAGEAIVDASGRLAAFSGCGRFTDAQVTKLRGVMMNIRALEVTRQAETDGPALVCFEHFHSESYIATTKIVLLLGGSCKPMLEQQKRVTEELSKILLTPATGYGSCKSSSFADDNLRLFVGYARGPWYWSDSTGGIREGERCGKLPGEQMQEIETLLAPAFKPE